MMRIKSKTPLFLKRRMAANQTAHKKKKKWVRGFTLIEIMIVVVILGILATLVVPAIMDRPDHARRVRAKQDIRTIVSALNLYRLDNLAYPTSLEDLAGGENKYLERTPNDPWGNPYQYIQPGIRGGRFDVYSHGSDGYEGGTGLDADIGNWNLEED